MKRSIRMGLIILFALFVGFSVAEDAPDRQANLILEKVASFANVGSTMYISTEDHIYQWDGKTDAEYAFPCMLSGQLISNGNELFLMDIKQGKLYLLSNGTSVTAQPVETYELPQDSFKDSRGEPKQIRNVVLTQNYLYILLESENPLWKDLLIFEYHSGKYTALKNIDIYSIGRYQNDSIIAASYDIMGLAWTCEFRLYDGLNGNSLILFDLMDMRPENLIYQQETNSLFIRMEDFIYVYDFHNRPKIVGRATSLLGQQACVVNDTYICLNSQDELRSLTLNMDGIQPKTLTFAGDRSVSADDNPAFSTKHPNIVVRFRDAAVQTDYATELITNTNAADIYCLTASSQTYRSLIAKGYVAPLSSNQRIAEAVNQMYPQITENLMTDSGKIAAIPFGDIYSPIQYAYDPKVWKEAGITGIPTTVDEFLTLCQRFAQRDDLFEEGWHFSRTTEAEMLKKEILQLILQVYISEKFSTFETPSVCTPEFMKLLSKYEETLPAIETICFNSTPFPLDGYDEHEVMKKSLLTAPGTDLLPDEASSSNGSNMTFLLLTIQKDAEPIIDVDMTVFVVNTFSPNIDLAIEYLELYLDSMSERERILYFPSVDAPVEAYYYQEDKAYLQEKKTNIESQLKKTSEGNQAELKMKLLSVENDLETLERKKWAISSDSIDMFKAATQYMKVYENFGINFFMSGSIEMITLLNQYINGAIPKEQFANRYNAIRKMIFLEKDQ